MIPQPAIRIAYLLYERLLQRQVSGSLHVSHVAVIQDGNRRFARHQGLSAFAGHRQGAITTEMISDWCLELGIKHLTVYAFSTENFARQDEEKEGIFDLIAEKLREMVASDKIHRNRVRVRAIGRVEMLPERVQRAVQEVEEATLGYDRLYFNLALAYGGQCELADAARNLARQVKAGAIRPSQVDEETIGHYLYPHGDTPVPKVDLIIRTGGETRTSNFLPWQANGNECAAYFCAPYWPEFRKIDFLRALRTSQSRMASKSTGL